MRLWLIVLSMGALTYGLRLSLILLLGRIEVPRVVQRALRFVPPAVFSAIVFPDLLRPGGTVDLSVGNVRLLAGALAAMVAWRTKSMVLTIATGMVALWILRALVP